MKVVFKDIKAIEFSSLGIHSGMKPRSVEASTITLKNTLFMVGVRSDDDTLIGVGRVVGDGATSFVVNDTMVDKKIYHQGIGSMIMSKVDSYLEDVASKDCFISLVSDVSANHLYEKYGFKSLMNLHLLR